MNPKVEKKIPVSSKLIDYFNKQPRLGTLSTASKDGKANSAYFGSPFMIDEKTIIPLPLEDAGGLMSQGDLARRKPTELRQRPGMLSMRTADRQL
jgi:hypothetical protein